MIVILTLLSRYGKIPAMNALYCALHQDLLLVLDAGSYASNADSSHQPRLCRLLLSARALYTCDAHWQVLHHLQKGDILLEGKDL